MVVKCPVGIFPTIIYIYTKSKCSTCIMSGGAPYWIFGPSLGTTRIHVFSLEKFLNILFYKIGKSQFFSFFTDRDIKEGGGVKAAP